MKLTFRLVKVKGKDKPNKRSYHSVTTNENNTKSFIFGGYDDVNDKYLNDLWILSCLLYFNLSIH